MFPNQSKQPAYVVYAELSLTKHLTDRNFLKLNQVVVFYQTHGGESGGNTSVFRVLSDCLLR